MKYIARALAVLLFATCAKAQQISGGGGSGGGSGTVTTLSVVTANGFAGSVANPTTTPAITLSTSVTGNVCGNGTALSACSTTGTGATVLANTPTLITPVLGVANGTSLALGGATIGTNALAVTGTANISGNTSVASAGGVLNIGASTGPQLWNVGSAVWGFQRQDGAGGTQSLEWEANNSNAGVRGAFFFNAAGLGTKDTNISRNAAGIIQFGTTAANAAGAWLAAKGTLTGGTLADQAQVLAITATQPASPTGTQNAVSWSITGAGSASQVNRALNISYLGGYSGSSSTMGAQIVNSQEGTASTLIRAAESNGALGNLGLQAGASGATTGLMVGLSGFAETGNTNVGVLGTAQTTKNSAKNIGVVGTAINAGTTPVQIGGFFSLNQTSVPSVSAALLADNGAQTDAIFLARDNGSTVFTIADGGGVTATAAIRSNTGFNANGTAGASATVSVRDNTGLANCDLVYSFGLFVSTTCP